MDLQDLHAFLHCKVGGDVDRRRNRLRDWLCAWLVKVCHVPWADTEQHGKGWDEWVQAKCPVSGAPQFRTVETPDGPKPEPVMELNLARLDAGFNNDEGVLGYVDVS